MVTPDLVTLLIYVAAAIALILGVWKGGVAWAEAKIRRKRGDRPVGEERLKAYAAMVEVGMPPAAADAAFSSIGPAPAAPATPPPPPSSSKGTVPLGIPLPDPHVLARVAALEAKVAALEAQVGAPAAADLQGMRAPRPGDDASDAPRPPGLRAFP